MQDNPADLVWVTDGLPLLAAGLLYLICVIMARWNLIAWPARRSLAASITDTRSIADIEGVNPNLSPEQLKALAEAERLLTLAEKVVTSRPACADVILWSRGQEQAAWRSVHRARVLVSYAMAMERARVRLEAACTELAAINTPEAAALAAAAKQALEGPNTPEPRLRAVLEQCLLALYAWNDGEFGRLDTQGRKSMWFVGVALVLVVVVGMTQGHAALLLMGAVGGLASRLMRVLKTQAAANDYGASWTTLFLSPLAGALAGWGGVLLVSLLGSDAVKLLGAALSNGVLWDGKPTAIMLALALLFGLSEKKFTQVVETLEGRGAGQKDDAGTSGGGGSLPGGVPPPAPPPGAQPGAKPPAVELTDLPETAPAEEEAEPSEDSAVG